MIGQLLDGRYRIKASLGAGGFGQTFIAEDSKQFDKVCVVKQLKPVFSSPEALVVARRLFESEAQLLNRLGDHSQIPQLLAYFEVDNEFFLVQECVEGHGLDKEIVMGEKQSEAYAIALLDSLLEPLAFIHQQQVIHRDIKPANLIRRQQDGKIVLIDFGAVKELAVTQVNTQGQTQVGTIIGTPGYMAMEQGRGKPKCSSDVYAVGMMIVQALTGKLPPVGYNPSYELQEDPDTAEIIWRQDADVSPEFAAILDKMIRYDFRQRYRSAMEVQGAIAQLSSQGSQGHTGTTLGGVNENKGKPELKIPATVRKTPAATKPAATKPQTETNPVKAALAQLSPQAEVSLNVSSEETIAEPTPVTGTMPVQRAWAKVVFRGVQRFIGVTFLVVGLPVTLLTITELADRTLTEEQRGNAKAALMILGLPLTGSGSWMLWSLHRRVIKEEKDGN